MTRAIVVLALAAAVLLGAASASARTVGGCQLRHHSACRAADLHGRDLRGVTLHHADLRDAVLHHADLRGANLEHADLRGADLRYADLRGARLRGAKLHYHRGGGRPGAQGRQTPTCTPSCGGADLDHANLANAQLAGANLSFADLSFADLTGAELRATNLDFANLTSAILTSSDFTGAINCVDVLPAGILDGRGCADQSAPVCYTYSPYADATGIFTVTGNTFSQTSVLTIPDADTEITALTVTASVKSASIPITTASRNFTVLFSGATTNSYAQTLNGNSAPWNTGTGTMPKSRAWDVVDTGYGVPGAGRIKVYGGGSLNTWAQTPPASDQRIYVVVSVAGTQRTAVPCS